MDTIEPRTLSPGAKALIAISILGAINWGLIGFFNWNLVDAVFGGGAREVTSGVSRFIYALIGLCGLLAAFLVPWATRRAPAGPRVRATGTPTEVRP